jgi:hypothetical protein
MNMHLTHNGIVIAAIASALLVGCGTKAGNVAPNASVAENHHEGDGHDHSSAEHSHFGPHGGHIIELGSNDAFHAELLHDDKTHRVAVYILDGKATNSVPISQSELLVNIVSGGNPKQFKLSAVSQQDEPQDMASCFQAENVELCTALDAENCKGRLAVNIEGKQYVGEIEQHDHDDHEHASHGDHQYK